MNSNLSFLPTLIGFQPIFHAPRNPHCTYQSIAQASSSRLFLNIQCWIPGIVCRNHRGDPSYFKHPYQSSRKLGFSQERCEPNPRWVSFWSRLGLVLLCFLEGRRGYFSFWWLQRCHWLQSRLRCSFRWRSHYHHFALDQRWTDRNRSHLFVFRLKKLSKVRIKWNIRSNCWLTAETV